MYIKTNVWMTGQVVIVIAGSNRELTQIEHQEKRQDLLILDSDADGSSDVLDIEPLLPRIGSRINPASIGEPLTVKFEYLFESYEAKITLLDIIRGATAWQRIQQANMFNDKPRDGFEYVLAKIRFEYLKGPGPDVKYDLSGISFDAISSNGKEYEDPFIVEPEPGLRASLYPGASHEGWATYEVALDDKKPLLTFGRDYMGRGGIWFKLHY